MLICFLKKCVPKQVHQQDHFLSKLCAILVTPEPCFLSSRLHGSTIFKNGLITKSCKQTSQSTTKWKPQASILSPRVKQLPFVGKQNAVRKITQKKNPKKSRRSCSPGMGGSLKFNSSRTSTEPAWAF